MASNISPLRYPGGKAALAPLLADLCAHNELHDGLLVEPFAGGAGASLQLLLDEYVSRIIINDLDPHIYAFWRAVLNQTDALIDRIQNAKVSMSVWRTCRNIYNGRLARTPQLDVAFATFFLNRCNRSGILMGGGPIGGHEQSGRWKLDARFTKEDLIGRIRRVASYRERIRVTRIDAVSLLELVPTSMNPPLVFLDPPYYEKGQRLYLNALEHDDHEELAKLLLSNPPFRWILTYDNTPTIRHLYRHVHIHPFTLQYSAYRQRTGREVLIIDPRLDVPTNVLAKHHRPGRLQFDCG